MVSRRTVSGRTTGTGGVGCGRERRRRRLRTSGGWVAGALGLASSMFFLRFTSLDCWFMSRTLGVGLYTRAGAARCTGLSFPEVHPMIAQLNAQKMKAVFRLISLKLLKNVFILVWY